MARFGSVISSIGDLNKDQFNGEYIYIYIYMYKNSMY